MFPADSGGKIRTGQILRYMKGRRYDISLMSPLPGEGADRYAEELASVCDRFEGWPERIRPNSLIGRAPQLLSKEPASVVSDRNPRAAQMVAAALAGKPDLVVFDFIHSVAVAPKTIDAPSVMFTHNVECEIFRRHSEAAKNPFARALWRDQHRKMAALERRWLPRFDRVVAVSERDGAQFRDAFGCRAVDVIPTTVDTDFFAYHPPADSETVVFTGSMDWRANIDAIEYYIEAVWPRIAAARPAARTIVVGRNPPERLVALARSRAPGVTFTGFVDDVRPYAREASVYIIPLRVGGGTRIKAFEAMAMGPAIVSTSIGCEGLPAQAGEHYLCADAASDFAAAVLRLFDDKALRRRLSENARSFVEKNYRAEVAGAAFEAICDRARLGRTP
ncbi:MAG: glycosyltransferase [Parvularculaceae bacterium]